MQRLVDRHPTVSPERLREHGFDGDNPWESWANTVTDADGIDLPGVRTPDVEVPLATHLPWNPRGPGYAPGAACGGAGASLPFAPDEATGFTMTALRMLSFRALSEMQQTEKQMLALETMKQFEHRLLSLERFSISKSPQDAPANLAVRAVLQRWNSRIRPLELAAASGDAAALAQAAVEIPDFVNQIDHVVRLIEEELESKATLLRVIQLGLLAGIVIISIFTIWMLHLQLVQPLAHLLEAAKTVSQGSFSARVAHVSDDELGQLGRAFNTMVSEIAHMYAHLEDKVQEKTRELTRINESLELLYRTSQQLAASDLTLDTVQTTLRDIEAALELGHSAICISENRQFPAHPVVGNMAPEEMHTLCGQLDCSHCFAAAREPLSEQVHALPMVVVPISDSDKLHGTLPIFLKPGSVLTPEKIRIIETVGHHISNALSNMQRNEEKHRLAVLEERSVIARELHDSIAQSLSYLKIQVTRLEKCINQGCDPRTITDELKQGLNTAYRELRELITTFRLRIDERGFNAALHATITEFSDKLGFPIRLGNSLSGIILSGKEVVGAGRTCPRLRSGVAQCRDDHDGNVARGAVARRQWSCGHQCRSRHPARTGWREHRALLDRPPV